MELKAGVVPKGRNTIVYYVYDLKKLLKQASTTFYVQVWLNSNNPIEVKISKRELLRTIRNYSNHHPIDMVKTNKDNVYLLG